MKRRGLIGGLAVAGAGLAGVLPRSAQATTGTPSVCRARIVGADVLSHYLYLVGYNGSEISWGGTALHVPAGWSTYVSNAGLAPSTLYYAYVYASAGLPALELSTTGHGPDANWNETKLGDPSRLLVGMVYTSPGGQFWRDSQHALILNWHNRLPLFVAPPAGGASCNSPVWQELGAQSQNQMELLTWGYQLGIAEAITLGLNGTAALNVDGGRGDLVFGDLALGPSASA